MPVRSSAILTIGTRRLACCAAAGLILLAGIAQAEPEPRNALRITSGGQGLFGDSFERLPLP